jgi:[CysO sulfur-carrier protein]-S-L-cysteine hydrolase
VLRLPTIAWHQMLAHAFACLPEEACGLLAGRPLDDAARATVEAATDVVWFQSCDNAAHSSKVYTVDARQHLAADRRAEADGLEIVGVMHSHTHTEPYPSPTDIAQAVDPGWHYLIVSLRDNEPMVRSWRIIDGEVTEEPVEIAG